VFGREFGRPGCLQLRGESPFSANAGCWTHIDFGRTLRTVPPVRASPWWPLWPSSEVGIFSSSSRSGRPCKSRFVRQSWAREFRSPSWSGLKHPVAERGAIEAWLLRQSASSVARSLGSPRPSAVGCWRVLPAACARALAVVRCRCRHNKRLQLTRIRAFPFPGMFDGGRPRGLRWARSGLRCAWPALGRPAARN